MYYHFSIKELHWSYGDYTHFRSNELPNKTPSARFRIPPFRLLVSDIPKTLKAIQIIAIALGFPSKINDKNILLKTAHIWVAGCYLELLLP